MDISIIDKSFQFLKWPAILGLVIMFIIMYGNKKKPTIWSTLAIIGLWLINLFEFSAYINLVEITTKAKNIGAFVKMVPYIFGISSLCLVVYLVLFIINRKKH